MAVTPSSDWQLKFRSYIRLLHCTAYIMRFYNILKAAVAGRKFIKDEMLTPAEVEAAEILVFKDSQKRIYSDELKRLSASPEGKIKRDSTLRLVHPIINEQGLLTVGGRLEKADLPTQQKHPVILSPKDHVTRLLFLQNHISLSHCGPSLLLSHVGERIYVPKLFILQTTFSQDTSTENGSAASTQGKSIIPIPEYWNRLCRTLLVKIWTS